MIRRRILQTTLGVFGMSWFLQLSFQDCGCGKAISFADLFEENGLRASKRDKNWRRKNPMKPSESIEQLISGLKYSSGKTLAGIRKAILEDDPEIIEEWKWMGSPVWSRDGMIAVGNAHKDKVKLTFSHGASLPDPDKLFNAGLGGNAWRAIDLFEGDKINMRALKNLVRAAIEYNRIKLKRNAAAGPRAKVGKGKK